MTLYTITADEVRNVRNSQYDALMLRVSNENNARTKETLMRHARVALKLSPLACAYIAFSGVNFPALYSSSVTNAEGKLELFNEKAIPKTWYLAQVLNGSAFEYGTNDGATLAFAIKALAAGMSANHEIQEYMRKGMCALGKGNIPGKWNSQKTQTSSSTRALEGLGIIVRSDVSARMWKVANKELFTRCVDAANGITAHGNAPAADDMAETASDDTTSDAGIVIDGEYVDLGMIELPALPAPATASDAAEEAPESDADGTAALPAPEALLALPAPASAPAKGRKGRKSKSADVAA